MTKISVCLTHYNRAEKLAATLESLARQSVMPDEVFVWDDKSPDMDPREVVAQFQGRFPRLVYHRNTTNLGMPGNLNAVLSQATGEYVANLHDADIFDPFLLEKWARALDSHPTAGMVFCGLRHPAKGSGEMVDTIIDAAPLTPGRVFFRDKLVGHLACPIWGTTMVRKSVHEELLPFDARFRNWADVDYWMRICLNHDLAYVPEALISLDSSETAERRFSWYRVFILHQTYIVNIRRHFADDPRQLRRALDLQCTFLRKRYFRMMFRTVKQADFRALWNGISFFPRIFSAQLHEAPELLPALAGPHR
jgi:GT2 family glycosyltransferase